MDSTVRVKVSIRIRVSRVSWIGQVNFSHSAHKGCSPTRTIYGNGPD